MHVSKEQDINKGFVPSIYSLRAFQTLPFIYRRKSLLIYRDVQNLKFLMREGGGEFTEVIVHKVKNLIQCS